MIRNLAPALDSIAELSELWSVGGNLNYTERVPDSAELFSDGAHHATESYEIGNPALAKETARGFELLVRRTSGKVTGQLTGFYTKFNDYIFLEETPGVERSPDGATPPTAGMEELPEKRYQAAKAKFYGLEVEVDWLAIENPGWSLLLSAYGDTLRATNESEGTNLPRIAPARLGVGFEVEQGKLDYGMRLTRSFKQDDVAVHGSIVKKQPLPILCSMPLPPTMLIWEIPWANCSSRVTT